jgi:hypothetical protein
MDEIDRILSNETHLEPSPELARRVMDEVRRVADAPPPLAFPWKSVATAAAILCVVDGAVAAMPELREPAQRALTTIEWPLACGALGTLAILLVALWAAWRAD